jgi:hypothetical protein
MFYSHGKDKPDQRRDQRMPQMEQILRFPLNPGTAE